MIWLALYGVGMLVTWPTVALRFAQDDDHPAADCAMFGGLAAFLWPVALPWSLVVAIVHRSRRVAPIAVPPSEGPFR